jgi:conjugative relaxase-like TrwC/TraI family protein
MRGIDAGSFFATPYTSDFRDKRLATFVHFCFDHARHNAPDSAFQHPFGPLLALTASPLTRYHLRRLAGQNALSQDREGMLSIGKLGIGQEIYYLEKVAEGAEDYCSGEGEVAGQWGGDAARELELSGEVGPDQLTAMLTGRNPVDGSSLLGNKGVPGKGSVPGFDLTFSAPKSVSLTWALGGPDAGQAVIEAHHHSVEAALGYMQHQACWTRRGAGGSEFVPGNGYLAAAFDHRSSRNGDPQLHTHVLIANATKGPDGRWTRLYHPAIYDHAKTASAIYEANLRHELTRSLGVRWQEVRHGIAEIAGFEDSHLREFSTRRAEILEAAGGPEASARARQVATLATRGTKEHALESDMRERWGERAAEVGLSREAIRETFDFRRARFAQADEPVRCQAEAVGLKVTASASHFDRRDAIQAVAGMRRDQLSAADVERFADEFLASGEALRISTGPKGERFTTRRVWEMEQGALDTAQRMREEGTRAGGSMIAERALCAHPTLKDDQREMVHRLLAEREGVSVVIGEAGTGKSYAILAAARGWSEAGMELRVAAPTWRAANVLRAEGLEATSLASLLAELGRAEAGGREGLNTHSVLLIDEAGMVDSADLARLIHHADAAEAKLVLVGDPEQLGEIGAGGLFRALAERSDPIRLDEVIRHESEVEREGARLIREGEGAEALDLYRSEERVVVAPDAEARREAMLAEWHESFGAGGDAVMVAKQNIEVERLNAMARELRREAGQLGESEIEVGEARFAAGDQVITRVNDREADIYNRERWQVAEVDPDQRRVVLEGIDQARTVEVGADYLAKTNPHSDAPALQHAYAVTTYSAQGSTVDRTFVAADPSMDKQELYVATSRSRGETTIYATPEIQAAREEIAPEDRHLRRGIPHIAEASQRDRAQRAAHDEAKRAELRGLPPEELVSRRSDLASEASAEERDQGQRRHAENWLRHQEENLDHATRQREAAEAAPRKVRREALPDAEFREAYAHDRVEESREELRELPPVRHEARAELANADLVLAERRQAAITAAKLSPPAYITAELGERPSDPEKRRSWDKGVSEIERYRQEHGIRDPEHALGREHGTEHDWSREQARERLQQRQVELRRTQERGIELEAGHSMEIGL